MAATPYAHACFSPNNTSIRSLGSSSFFPIHPTRYTRTFSSDYQIISSSSSMAKRRYSTIIRFSASPPPPETQNSPPPAPFGYTRKDVLLIGLGITVGGIAMKSGLEFIGVDSLKAGNVVQLVLVLGLTVGWISTYIFRVSNKEMTYAQQLRDYEEKVMEKRLDSLTEAELAALLEKVEEEKRRLGIGGGAEDVKNSKTSP